MVPSVSVLTEFDCTLYFTLYWDDDYAGSTVQHDPMNYPPVFWHFPISWLYHQVDLKKKQLVTYPENETVNLE